MILVMLTAPFEFDFSRGSLKTQVSWSESDCGMSCSGPPAAPTPQEMAAAAKNAVAVTQNNANVSTQQPSVIDNFIENASTAMVMEAVSQVLDKAAPAALGVLGDVVEVSRATLDEEGLTVKEAAKYAGGKIGGLAGAVVGGAVGTGLGGPGTGTATGAYAGSVVGSAAGETFAEGAYEAITNGRPDYGRDPGMGLSDMGGA